MLHTGWSSTHCRLCSCRGGMDRWKYFHTGYASLATMTNGTDRQLCSYSYPSSHWIHVGRSMTGFCSCYRHRRGRLSMVCVFNYCVLESFMNHTYTHTHTHTHIHTPLKTSRAFSASFLFMKATKPQFLFLHFSSSVRDHITFTQARGPYLPNIWQSISLFIWMETDRQTDRQT